MSGISRSSLTALPKTGAVTLATTVGTGSTGTILQPSDNDVVKVISVTTDNQSLGAITCIIAITDGTTDAYLHSGENVTAAAGKKEGVALSAVIGDLVFGSNLKITVAAAGTEETSVEVIIAYVLVN